MWPAALLALIWGSYAALGQRWRIKPLLAAPGSTRPDAKVVAVVPARNEAVELPHTLPTLFQQRHVQLHVVLVDDHSEDGTANVARRLATEAAATDRFTLINSAALPSGWTGKVWAQHQGVEYARQLGAEWIWLTDADICHAADVLQRLLTTAELARGDMVSVMARLRCATGFEKLLIPAFTYFFAGLYPFGPIGDEASRQAGAAGGCVLVHAPTLARVGGMAAIRDAVIDDVSLARVCKAAGARLWLGHHPGVNSTRGYASLANIWDMVARSAYTQLRYSPFALIGCVLGLAYVFLGPVAAMVCGSAGTRLFGLLAYAAMVRTYYPMVTYLGCAPVWALLLPLSATLYTGMTVSSAWRHYKGTGAAWKGRSYRPS